VVFTLCISLAALAVAIGTLIWSVISWRRSGPRVKVIRTHGAAFPTEMELYFIGIRATNSGRLATQLRNAGFQLPNGTYVTALKDFLGLPVQYPKELSPGATIEIDFDVKDLRHALAGRRFGKKVRPFVETGHGVVRGKAIDLAQEVDRLS
jgi:hypothetical protein